jgi:hypothetical protein
MKFIIIIRLLTISLLMISCESKVSTEEDPVKYGPSRVELRKTEGRYRLFVNGEEFYVKGAGCEFGPCGLIAEHGGNSIRTWRVHNGVSTGREVLDKAWENGLMVMMGLDVGRERHGFDYNDDAAVARQFEEIKKNVIELKDHPALLGWGIGNELNHGYTNMRVWDAVNDIAKMISEVDGTSVVTTMLAGIGRNEVEYIRDNCPYLDFISVQMYGDIINLNQRLAEAGYDGPYLVTEWGATGHWEMPETDWGSPVEQSSAEKADAIMIRYEKAILSDPVNCLGSYVFLWGQKQERTPTWYGLFTENGERTEAVNVMEYLWTGKWPEQMAPRILDAQIKDRGGRFDSVELEEAALYSAIFEVEYSGNGNIYARAEILPEPEELSDGGDFEQRPETIGGLIKSATTDEVVFMAPARKGAYRLFIYVSDDASNTGTINIPFLIP